MATTLDIVPGERVVSRTGGGGGYGDPLERASDRVLDDVLEGWVSRDRALAIYGVVLVGEDGELHVDVAATRQERVRRIGA
jgi:N-methylhydantoinase B